MDVVLIVLLLLFGGGAGLGGPIGLILLVLLLVYLFRDGGFRAEAMLALRGENHRLRIELEVAQGALKIATLYMLNAQAEAEGLRPQPVSAMTRGDVLHRALRAGA